MGDRRSATPRSWAAGASSPRGHLAELCRERGELERATALLEACLRERPGYSAAVAPLASVLLAGGVDAEDLRATVTERLGHCTTATRLALGGVLRQAGELDGAARELEGVLESEPDSSSARLVLGEILLAQRRHRDSAELLAQIPAKDPQVCDGLRCELLALLAGGELEARAAGTDQGAGGGPAASRDRAVPRLERAQGRQAPRRAAPGGLAAAADRHP